MVHGASSNIAHDRCSIKHLLPVHGGMALGGRSGQGLGEPKIVHFLLPYTSFFFGALIRMEWSRPLPSRFYLELQMPQCKVCTTPKTDNNSQMRERPLNRLKGQPAEKMVTHCLTSLFRLLLQLYLHHDCFLSWSWIPPARPRYPFDLGRCGVARGTAHTKVSCHS